MSEWAEIVASFDVLNRIEGFLSTFRYAAWERAYQARGVNGLIDEFMACLFTLNCWTIRVNRHADWDGEQIEDLLRDYGVHIWGRGFTSNDYTFFVKERQARWAEYVLLCQGIPITGRLYDPRNREYAEHHAPGDQWPTES
jgi:hypothetical protein